MRSADLKEWRKKLGLTQEEAGRRFGVSRVAEQNWESGNTPIPRSVEAAIETIEMEWRQRPEFGPVLLRYSTTPLWRAGNRVRASSEMRTERFANNESAIKRAEDLWGRSNFCDPFIWDEMGKTVWSMPQLKEEIERRRGQALAKDDVAKLIATMNEIADHCSSLPVLDTRSDDEILGYDERGLPS